MKNRPSKSLSVLIVILYFFMTIINITLLIAIISNNQAEVMTENASFRAREMFGSISAKMKEYMSGFSAKNSAPDSEEERLKILDYLLSPILRNYLVSDGNGRIIRMSKDAMIIPMHFAGDVRKSIINQEFLGTEYLMNVDSHAAFIHYYYPLSRIGFSDRVLYAAYDLKGIRGKYDKLFATMIVIVIVVVLLHLFMALYIYRLIVHPIFQLRDGVRKIAEGEYEVRVEARRKDEIGELASGFNAMAEQISNKILQLKRTVQLLDLSNSRLERMATMDELTGIYNRRHFYTIFRKVMDIYFRYQQIFSLVMLDIDLFKNINDTYGHEAGDLVLKNVADILKRECREADEIARYGGEEFIILLPNTSSEGAYLTAERIRNGLIYSPVFLENHLKLEITASFGVCDAQCVNNPDRQKFMELAITSVDKALYQAKNKGRNRVEIFSGDSVWEST